jgi:HAD superfamily hydrolase (TIGR01509 family)
MIRGVIFDLDGTLVDSRLDFDAMRVEMELPPELPILESLEPRHAERCHEILHRHELEGAERAVLLPGVRELVEALHARSIHQAVATRNSRQITETTLSKLDLPFDLVLTRDDGPVKPDPWAVHEGARRWSVATEEIVVVGDHRFDVECGRAAGSRTVLLTHPIDPRSYANGEQADLVLASLAEHEVLLSFLKAL